MTPSLWNTGWPWNQIAWCKMANTKLTERWRLCYTQSDRDSGDTLIDLDMSFENVTDDLLAKRLQTFLKAAGREDMAKIEK